MLSWGERRGNKSQSKGGGRRKAGIYYEPVFYVCFSCYSIIMTRKFSNKQTNLLSPDTFSCAGNAKIMNCNCWASVTYFLDKNIKTDQCKFRLTFFLLSAVLVILRNE